MWKENNNALEATFEFDNFVEAFSFMTAVAFECEKMDHHPNWSNVWNKVHIILNTHDAGNVITEKDHKLSEKITSIFNNRIPSK